MNRSSAHGIAYPGSPGISGGPDVVVVVGCGGLCVFGTGVFDIVGGGFFDVVVGLFDVVVFLELVTGSFEHVSLDVMVSVGVIVWYVIISDVTVSTVVVGVASATKTKLTCPISP